MPASAPAAGGDQDQAEAQRERRAQREQLQRQQHHRADHGGEVEAADREQMGEARAAHRLGVGLGNAILVAGGERGGDAALAAPPSRARICAERRCRQPAMRARKALARRRARRARCRARGRCRRSAGTRRRARNHRRRAPPSAPAASARRAAGRWRRARARRHAFSSSTLTRSRAGRPVADRARPAGGRLRSAASACTLSTRAVDLHHPLALEPRRGGALGLPPDQAAAERGGEAKRASARPQRVPGASASGPSAGAGGEQQEGGPSRPVRQPEPGGDAEHQPDREPERKLGPLGLEAGVRSARPTSEPARRSQLEGGASAMLGALA